VKIINANTLLAKNELLDLISKIKNVSQPRDVIDLWLTTSLGTEMLNAWIAVKDNQTVGMIICEIVEPYDPKVYIDFNWAKPGVKINGELITKVESWALSRDIHKLIFYTKTSPTTLIKKHGFRLVQSVLDKEI